MMKRVLAGLLVLVIATSALAETDGPSPVEQVIRDQIDAFRDGDLDAAWAHASPMIQRMFQSPDRFGQMVQQGYPMVWRPADLHFGDTYSRDTTVYQRVVVRDTEGTLYVLEYEMLPLGDRWRINGVRMIGTPGAGA